MTAPVIGAVSLALAVTGAASWLISPLPMPQDPAALASHVQANRTELFVYAYFGALGSAAQIFVYVGLRQLATDARWAGWARVGLACMLAQVIVVAVAFSIFAAVALRQPEPDQTRVLVDASWLLINLAAGPVTALGLLAYAIALVREGRVGAWLLPFTGFVAAAHLLVAATFAEDGFFSPDGALAVAVPLAFFAWLGLVGATLLHTRPSRA